MWKRGKWYIMRLWFNIITPQPIAQNPQPYIEVEWKIVKTLHGYNKMLFLLLERKLIDDFFKRKIKMNPSKDVSFDDFIEVLEQWIFKSNGGQPQMAPIYLKTHYRIKRPMNKTSKVNSLHAYLINNKWDFFPKYAFEYMLMLDILPY